MKQLFIGIVGFSFGVLTFNAFVNHEYFHAVIGVCGFISFFVVYYLQGKN